MTALERTFLAFVIDDNKEMRDLLRRMLRDLGIGTSDFRAAEPALAALSSQKPDLLFVDYKMAPMDGIAFTQALRRSQVETIRTAPVIMITGHVDPHVIAAAQDAGVDDFLAKPISPAVLGSRIRKYLRKDTA